MLHHIDVRSFLGIALVITASSLTQCTCPDHECDVATDCEGRWWYMSECPEDQGHWSCEDHTCSARCGEVVCDSSLDCLVESWPDDAGCKSQDGYWECRDSACVAVCNDSECAQAVECLDHVWPGDVGCAEADGYWDCRQGACVALCNDGECTQSSDCADHAWPDDVGCTETEGHWDCRDQVCVAVCDSGCSTHEDCVGRTWPGTEVDCEESHGHWECPDGACVAACNTECDEDSGCAWKVWNVRCVGHWDCVQGQCNEVCDDTGCGDETCDEAGGETKTSCPGDCTPTCVVAQDCIDAQWDLPCDGRWVCPSGSCVSECDYQTCGDGQCDAAGGESAASCAEDCMEQCQMPIDCVDKAWTLICQGHWTCNMGTCNPACDSLQCGDGQCSPQFGETGDSCYKDCHDGPCAKPEDCVGLTWNELCQGQWQCDGTSGSCSADCSGNTCGDGTCDVSGGEDAGGCATDCSEYGCSLTGDCSDLTLPAGCRGWLCIRRMCIPQCP
ncbi:MAG: hypothetical protein J7M25_10180 [Deltaproteobacteria bacterium]|nr:hypothetical protein [Deltaproteobacteria bacterium]